MISIARSSVTGASDDGTTRFALLEPDRDASGALIPTAGCSPCPNLPSATSSRAPEDPEVTRIRSALLAGVSAETPARTDEERARALLADLIDWRSPAARS